ncbi:MAG: type I-E CRISPR-associated protein Cas7/Cse4/CasC [Nostocoides sp.]
MNRTIIDLHILQTVPPSNINRDETGSPKTAYYGGVRRARVSSQAWKRATRRAMAQHLDRNKLSTRTVRVTQMVADAILTLDPACEDAAARAEAVLKAAGLNVKAPKRAGATLPENGYLMFLSSAQANRLAELALNDDIKEIKDEAKAALREDQGIDIALFGRMVADDKSLSVDAACQVAHAISVDAVAPEFDYYTAVDDLNEDDESGAGMIGTIEFNSSTLYRYATVDVDALNETLGDPTATAEATGAFVEAFVRSMPTGKQNTFANRTLPDGVVVMVRSTQPVNLVQAFESPVTQKDRLGRVEVACQELVREANDIVSAYGESPEAAFVVAKGERAAALTSLGESVSLDELAARVRGLVTERLGGVTDD